MSKRSRRRSAEEWSELIHQFRTGHESEAEFCQRLNLNQHTFRKHKYQASGARKRDTSSFTRVAVAPSGAAQALIRVRSQHGVVVELPASMEMTSVARLVQALHHAS